MITLGIDPGTARLGYGVVDDIPNPHALTYGVAETSSSLPMPHRLVRLYEDVVHLIEKYQPRTVAIEQLFFARNVTTAMTVGQARGVVLLAAAQADLEIVEYTPAEVKHATVGYGKADKAQVQEMVRLLLNLEHPPYPDDAADALAIALCHCQSAAFREITRR